MSTRQGSGTRASRAAPSPPGPLARKVIGALAKRQRQQVIDLSAWRQGKAQAEAINEAWRCQPSLADLDPLHARYAYGQNQLGAMIEQLSQIPALGKLTDAYAAAEEAYRPGGPPMSPLTNSYFTSWGAFDLAVGVKRESFASIAIALCRQLQPQGGGLRTVFETLQRSRMGVYRHDGADGRSVQLTELVTGRSFKALSPSGYRGQRGELWLARVLPPQPELEPLEPGDSAVVFTTPYLLGEVDGGGRYRPAREADWQAYFTRTLPRVKSADTVAAYEQLMKYGLTRHYWNEYLFLAYFNHRPDSIWLAGWPDRPDSLPHSPASRSRWRD